jgi:hypothetical protein
MGALARRGDRWGSAGQLRGGRLAALAVVSQPRGRRGVHSKIVVGIVVRQRSGLG